MLALQIRLIDICISLTLLISLSPVILIISFLIFIFDGRPVIYKQSRVGLKGKMFVIYKFRTMKQVAYKNEELRLTYLGKILRKTSFDELPQLLNVLFKDMSMVGPRPLPKEVENKIKSLSKTKRRKVLPGITGMSQINYSGKKRSLNEKINLDIKFIDNYTLYNYFYILLRTPIVLVYRFFKNKSSIIK